MGLTIFCNGRFDVLHAGHFNILNFCRTIAGPNGTVIVAIDSDDRISKGNCKLPIIPQDIRKINLSVLNHGTGKLVDWVKIFNTDQELRDVIEDPENRIDFIVKGSEWADKPIIGSNISPVIFFDSTRNGFDSKISSSRIIEMVLEKNKQTETE